MTGKELIAGLLSADNLDREVVVEIVRRSKDGNNEFYGVQKIDIWRVVPDYITPDKTIRINCEGELSELCEQNR